MFERLAIGSDFNLNQMGDNKMSHLTNVKSSESMSECMFLKQKFVLRLYEMIVELIATRFRCQGLTW